MKILKYPLFLVLILQITSCKLKQQAPSEELNLDIVSSDMILEELIKRDKITFLKHDTINYNLEHVMIPDSLVGRGPASFVDFSIFSTEQLLAYLEEYKRVDNRKDYYMVTKSEVRNNFKGIAVAMFAKQVKDNGSFKSRQLSEKVFQYGSRNFNGCSTNRFNNQFEFAKCTAFAISKWHLVTAGHEINPKNFKNYVFAFDMYVSEQGKLPEKIESENMFKPIRIEKHKYDKETGLDYTILRVNKPIPENRILRFSSSIDYDNMQRLYTIGSSEGLPLKYAADGFIDYQVNDNLVSTDLNAFEGNSGSPVFNENNKIIGMIIAGQSRYFLDNENQCVIPNSCLQYECAEEHVLKHDKVPYTNFVSN